VCRVNCISPAEAATTDVSGPRTSMTCALTSLTGRPQEAGCSPGIPWQAAQSPPCISIRIAPNKPAILHP
jgi:hypothetical protein